jgi:hypothetical protein
MSENTEGKVRLSQMAKHLRAGDEEGAMRYYLESLGVAPEVIEEALELNRQQRSKQKDDE